MIRWLLALVLGAAVAWLAYRRASSASRPLVAALALLRGAAVALVAAMLFGAAAAPAKPIAPLVALDASASWRRASGPDSMSEAAIGTALDSALASAGPAAGDIMLFGDSLRDVDIRAARTQLSTDRSSRVRPAVDRATALGRPLIVITDGELEDADAMDDAPRGSAVRVPRRTPRPDAAASDFVAPVTATAGDTLQLSVTVVAGGAGSGDGNVQILLDQRVAATAALAALAPYASTRLALSAVVPSGAMSTLLRAIVHAAGDADARNDSLTSALEIGDRPPAVFVSTAPDLDVREVLTVLRGALTLPTKAYLRLAPQVWREEGSLTPISESEVRARAAAAGLLILHGDTGFVARGRSARALWVPAPATALARAGESTRAAEWYVNASPPSPLAGALSGIPWDSLPPLTLASPARGTFDVLTARLGRSGQPITAVAGRLDQGARTLIASGSGFAGWSLRGGRNAEAFTALWGAMFDWLAAARSDARAARPFPATIREGEQVWWRRGGADSLVLAQITRRADGGASVRTPGAPPNGSRTDSRTGLRTGLRTDTLRLSFGADGSEVRTASLAQGVYDVVTAGGASVLVVNASREWVPRAPTTRAGVMSASVASSDAPRLADATWPFVAALLLLSAEWIGRRLGGLR